MILSEFVTAVDSLYQYYVCYCVRYISYPVHDVSGVGSHVFSGLVFIVFVYFLFLCLRLMAAVGIEPGTC